MSHEQDNHTIIAGNSSDMSMSQETSNETIIVDLSYPEIPDLELSGILGKGGSGTVYKGHQPFLKRDVAIKVLNVSNGAVNEEFIERFHREVQILANLIHPNIVSCFQAGMTKQTADNPTSPYLVMEFINGPTLQDWIRDEGVVELSTALSVIGKIASALDYAHKKTIIHRDIKAENILLNPLDVSDNCLDADFSFIPKLADLGIARSTQTDKDNNLTMVGTMIGTPSSMAPEQFNDPDNVDFKVDIYGLGCVLFHMVTGKKPYDGYNLTEMVIKKNSSEPLNPKEISPKLNKKVVNLILSMMAVRKDERPSSYIELIQQCQQIASELGKKSKNGKIEAATQSKKWLYMTLLFSIFIAVFVFFFMPVGTSEPVTAAIKVQIEMPQEEPQKKQEIVAKLIVSEETLSEKTVSEKTVSEKVMPGMIVTEVPEITEPLIKNYLNIRYADKNGVFLASGEAFNIMVSTQQDAYIYCYFEDQKGEIIRFFPNRFKSNSFVSKEKPIILPGESPFNLNASKDGISERLACFATSDDILSHLPSEVAGVDFETLPVQSLEEVKDIYLKIKDVDVADAIFDIRVY